MNRIRTWIGRYIFSVELPLAARFLNMTFFIGIVTAITELVVRVIMRDNVVLISIIAGVVVAYILALYLCNRFKMYRFGTWLVVIAVGDIAFPLAFFALGGPISSIPAFFVLSTVIVFLLMEGRSFIVLLLVHFVFVTATYLIGSLYSGHIMPYNEDLAILEQVSSIIVIGCCLGVIIKIQKSILLREGEKAKRMNKALAEESKNLQEARNDLLRREEILEMVNAVARLLLSRESRDLDETVQEAMGMMASTLHIDRMYVWKAGKYNGRQGWAQVYEWVDPEYQRTNTVVSVSGSTFLTLVPEWVELFENHGNVNGPVRLFSPAEYETIKDFDLQSLLCIPVFSRNKVWGFVSFDDCHEERTFGEDTVNILRSGAYIIINAILRASMQVELMDALDEAQQASKAKGDFLSNMSHEMRTPLNAIIGMTTIGRSASEIERKDYALEKVKSASTHLLGLINDVLDMSKIEANKFEISEVSFPFEKVLQKVVNVLSFRIEERHQHFRVTTDRKIPPNLIGDDQRLAQVITNLLSNAIKFTPEDGSIHLDAALLDETDGICTIKIEVADSGIGISEDHMSRLFTTFEQAESGIARKYGGTGLGLAISKSIVEMMDGEIWAQSEEGKGSTFSFTIKLHRDASARESLLDEGVNWDTIRLLVVDDDKETLAYFRELLTQFGLQFSLVASGEDALALIAQEGTFDIYFIDWKMPGMDGIELARRITALGGNRSVITMISATEWDMIAAEAKAAGVDHYLPKPLFSSAVADLINICIGVDRAVSLVPQVGGELEDFAGRRILIVEDIDINQEIVIALLEPTGIAIDIADNGLVALNMFTENPERYHMILMDVRMPEMDGLEATRRIRALGTRAAKNIPIVAMTANVFREDIEECLDAGMDNHLGKPIDFHELLDTLRRYLLFEADEFSNGRSTSNIKPLIVHYSRKSEEGIDWMHGVAWNKELEINHERIDEQHKELFRRANDLLEVCVSTNEDNQIRTSLEFFSDYLTLHFSDEEAIQVQCGFPDYEHHRKLHAEFKEILNDLVDEFEQSGETSRLCERMRSVVLPWMIKHIEVDDLKIAHYLQSIVLSGD